MTWKSEGPLWYGWSNSFQNAFPFNGLDSVFNLLSHLTLTHGFFNSYIAAYEGAYWSLSLEWQFYFLFLILALIGSRMGVLGAMLFPLMVTVAFR